MAGTKIWIASAIIEGHVLKIEDCRQAKKLLGATERDSCLQSLCYFISLQKMCTFGLDFPFSLPAKLIEGKNWEEFILSFSNLYPSPEKFRRTRWVTAGNRDWGTLASFGEGEAHEYNS